MDIPRYLLIVKVPRGLKIMDTPRPEGAGGVVRRLEMVGRALHAYGIHNIDGVDYARLVPLNPLKSEWLRVAEADDSLRYVDVIKLEESDETRELTEALRELANANTLLSLALRELAKRP
jgi:hypothetical protein